MHVSFPIIESMFFMHSLARAQEREVKMYSLAMD